MATSTIKKTDTTISTTLTLASDFTTYALGDVFAVYRSGNVVTITGLIKNVTAFEAGDWSNHLIATLPTGYRPPRQLNIAQTGGGISRWNLVVDTDGKLQMARFSYINNTTSAPSALAANTWTPVYATYVVS